MPPKSPRKPSPRPPAAAPPAASYRDRGSFLRQRRRMLAGLAVVFAAVVLISAAAPLAPRAWRRLFPVPPAPVRVPSVVRALPHDSGAFTQGLVYENGVFYESTGLQGKSSLRRVEVETGRVEQRVEIPEKYFAEGLASLDGRLVQLTWRHGEAFVYDKATFERAGGFRYEGEGWGLAFDGRRLVLSDGTDTLRFLDPATHAVVGRLRVTDAGRPVRRLNELEIVDGDLYANVWQTPRIARISLSTGRVLEWLDLSGLAEKVRAETPGVDVLNGIAWDAQGRRLFVTGKLWPHVYEIR